MGNELMEFCATALAVREEYHTLDAQIEYHRRVSALKAYWKDNDVAIAELEAEAALADTLDEALAKGDVTKPYGKKYHVGSKLEPIPPATVNRWRQVRDAGRQPVKRKMTDKQRASWSEAGVSRRADYYAHANGKRPKPDRITREGLFRYFTPPDVDPELPEGSYEVIVIDPPWPMKKIDRAERPNQTAFDYPIMDEDALTEMVLPAAPHCHLWCWTTHKYLPMALRLLDAWKFKYVCTFVWHKPGGPQPFGLPQYNAEFALYARRGSPEFVDTKAFPTCFDAKRGEHSAKPEEFYEMVRRVCGLSDEYCGIDMFNRRSIEFFDGWGNESKE